MSKRKLDEFDIELAQSSTKRTYKSDPTAKKHSLDSDEEDYLDDDNRLDPDDIEGEVDGIDESAQEERITAFNMREELEEGHFDKDGHFIWKNEKEIRDNWLDNIDWQQIKTSSTKYNLDPSDKGLADDSDSGSEIQEKFDEIELYKNMLTYMKPKETVNKTIRRLGGDHRKMSSVERLKRKKAGTLNINEGVTKLTEFANKILTETGNMDIYQETYEYISTKIESSMKKAQASTEPELDMYAEDFEEKEKVKIKAGTSASSSSSAPINEEKTNDLDKEVMWVFKWARDNEKTEGPFKTSQMLKWANEGYFKAGVWVRKIGENTPFYNSSRIDFDLYM